MQRVFSWDDEIGLGFQRLRLFTYSTMYFYHCGLLDIYFILWLIILVPSLFIVLLELFHFGYLAIRVGFCV